MDPASLDLFPPVEWEPNFANEVVAGLSSSGGFPATSAPFSTSPESQSQVLPEQPQKEKSRPNRRQDYVAPFLNKAFEIVNDPNTDDIVSWMPDGKSFTVWKPAECGRDLLPQYFKHNNFSSFVRQLNTYGFRKIDPDHWQFQHEMFQRGQPDLLKEMKRKPVGSSQNDSEARREVVEVGAFGTGNTATEIELLRRDKNILFMELVRLRKEQEQMQGVIKKLVGEMTENKRQHASTKSTVDRMMNFLATMFNNKNGANATIEDSKRNQRKRGGQKRVLDRSASESSDKSAKKKKLSRLQELSENVDQWTAEEQAAPTVIGTSNLGNNRDSGSENSSGKAPVGHKSSVQIEEVEDDDLGLIAGRVSQNKAPNSDTFYQLMQNASPKPNGSTSHGFSNDTGSAPVPLGKHWSFGTSGIDLNELQNTMDEYAHVHPDNADDAVELSRIIDSMINSNTEVE